MNIDAKLLSLLSNCKFHSGQALAEFLKVSRATIWKSVRDLRELGLDIYAVRGRGYRLATALELLDDKRILEQMAPKARSSIQNMDILWEVDSTNHYLANIMRQNDTHAYVCLTERQTEGRGRRGKHWVSPIGGNIYLSLLWTMATSPARLNGLSLAIATAVVDTLQALGVEEVGVKWPNDVLWHDRKLAGILLEMSGESAGPSQVIIGVGLNVVLNKQLAQAIDQPWVDLNTIMDGPVERNKLVANLLNNLIKTLKTFEINGLEPFLSKWRQYDQFAGRSATLRLENEAITGVINGIDEFGSLLLESKGKISRYHSGEVSLDVRQSIR